MYGHQPLPYPSTSWDDDALLFHFAVADFAFGEGNKPHDGYTCCV
jgi:hypothetical protein